MTVQLWQGTADTLGARPPMATFPRDAIGHSTLRLTGAGHLSILADHAGEIVAAVGEPVSGR